MSFRNLKEVQTDSEVQGGKNAMKIQYKHEVFIFGELNAGDVFSAANYEFIKTDRNNAVRLSDGHVFDFDNDDLIEPLAAQLYVEI